MWFPAGSGSPLTPHLPCAHLDSVSLFAFSYHQGSSLKHTFVCRCSTSRLSWAGINSAQPLGVFKLGSLVACRGPVFPLSSQRGVRVWCFCTINTPSPSFSLGILIFESEKSRSERPSASALTCCSPRSSQELTCCFHLPVMLLTAGRR